MLLERKTATLNRGSCEEARAGAQLPDGRQTAPYSPEFEPDIVLQRTNAIQAASYSLMCDTKKMRDSVHYT
jgi:hypothetical protein